MNAEQLREKGNKALDEVQRIADAAAKESRELTAEEQKRVNDLIAESDQADDQIQLNAKVDAFRAKFAGTEPRKSKRGSIGELVTGDEALAAWLKSFGTLPTIPRHIRSPEVPIDNMLDRLFGRKELIIGESDASAGAFVETDYTRIYEPLGRRETNLLSLIPRRPTTSDLVSWVRQTVQAAQAAPVHEANVTDFTGGTGEESGEKPEATVRWEPVTEPVKTIAVWIPATNRALSDVAQLRSLIDQDLREDLAEELEDQIADGDGVGENFTGILNTAGILTYAWDTDIFRTTRRAKTYLQTTGRVRPTAWLLNPEDWETIELTQDGDNRYYYGGPIANGEPRLWGVPVVESEAIPQGTGLLGDFRKAVLFERERVNIAISTEHSDFFIRNMVAIRAELRATLAVIRPTGFCMVEMESGS